MHQMAVAMMLLVQGQFEVPDLLVSQGKEAECLSVGGSRRQLVEHQQCDGSCDIEQSRCKHACKQKGRW